MKLHAGDGGDDDKWMHTTWQKQANTSFDFELLSKEDIPSASLNGKPLGS